MLCSSTWERSNKDAGSRCVPAKADYSVDSFLLLSPAPIWIVVHEYKENYILKNKDSEHFTLTSLMVDREDN